jgi:pyruvate kinase
MLSEESSLGRFPVESVSMLAKIAGAVEPYRKIKIKMPQGAAAAAFGYSCGVKP